ncbi:hypothetical protein CORC01_02736 [Colletotrichum orchidophilum]|uniref:Uncharacterized protein n=1 Tax=Colletotrichum orchidophilum TaxID=1209926 RepID=A0A1G4BKN6_9PEZI|nr:uncharacterized protein CORC01_02736 [Colletotrichum orchidophilum]OHF01858.1 hypothetical protein CORC01_02736 [Colletotrichum orchidophilum]
MDSTYEFEAPPTFHPNIRPVSLPVEDDDLLFAAMAFGMFNGTMILSFSQAPLKMVQPQVTRVTPEEDEEDGGTGDHDMSWLWDMWMEKYNTKRVTRDALGVMERPTIFAGVSREKQSWRLLTRRKPNPSRRLYFCSKGYAEGSRVAKALKGFLDFNESCTRLRGLIRSEFSGASLHSVPLEGLNVRD